ncbi:MAG: hypothetical protein HY908_09510 [Myxococcales bacterium]|nr:hypothetical protein [Myxococcales bacterium]
MSSLQRLDVDRRAIGLLALVTSREPAGAASLDVLKLRRLVAPERYDRGLQLLEGVVAMLSKRI